MSDFVWNIEEVNNNIFDYLLNRHFEEKKEGRDFFFFITSSDNDYGMRNVSGNDDHIIVRFWNVYDKDERWPIIDLRIESIGKFKLTIKLTEYDNANELKQIPGSILENKLLQKIYTTQHFGNYLRFLETFINGDKKMIDDYLDEKSAHYNTKNYATSVLLINQDEFYNWITDKLLREYNILKTSKASDIFFSKNFNPQIYTKPTIKNLEVRNYNGIEYLRIENIPVDTKWIVFSGENGYGKTTILQSIVIGLAGNMDGTHQLLNESGYVLLEGIFNHGFLNLSFNYNTRRIFIKLQNEIVVYGANRLNADYVTMEEGSRLFGSLFPPYNGLININDELKDANSYYPKRFQLLKDTFRELIPDLQDIKIETESGKPVVKFIERDPEGNEYKEVTFDQLASGFRNIIAIVGDIISRLFRENVDTNDLNDIKGFVIIDEFELHLHPKYQKRFPEILTRLFPNLLFIVATHSPIPLLGMPRETVIYHVNRTKENGITAEMLDIDFANLLPNSLLSSPIFDFQEMLPIAHENGKKIRTEDDYADVLFNKKLENKIEEIKKKYSDQ